MRIYILVFVGMAHTIVNGNVCAWDIKLTSGAIKRRFAKTAVCSGEGCERGAHNIGTSCTAVNTTIKCSMTADYRPCGNRQTLCVGGYTAARELASGLKGFFLRVYYTQPSEQSYN